MLQNVRETIKNGLQIAPRWLLVRWIALDSAPDRTRTPHNDAQMAPNGSQMTPRRVLVRSMASDTNKIRANR